MSNNRRALLLSLLAGVSLLACTVLEDMGLSGGPSKPTVEILSPPSGTQVTLGQQVEVQYRASDEVGVVRVLLEADGAVVDSQRTPSGQGEPSMSGVLRWSPTTLGSHTLVVYAYNGDGVPSDAVGVSIVALEESGAEPVATPEWPPPIDTPLVVPEPGEPTATPVQPTPTNTLTAPAPEPPTATHTSVPPTPVPPTRVPPTPVPPTATTPSISCPTLTIRMPDVVVGRPTRIFGIQFQRVGELPAGYGYVIEYSWDQTAWQRQDPVPASVRQDGPYWMAEARGLGVTGTSYWRLGLIELANLGATPVCRTPPWAINHTG
jgi:hypothetical protein